ncbi:MAG: hypothetical protein HP497_05830 [Nitrospira sp.]|nr:hypothetical protein [Nitrospira sp.]
MIQMVLVLVLALQGSINAGVAFSAGPENDERGWKLYTNARFGFSVRYPDDWRLGNPMQDGAGVTLSPPIEHSLVALSGHMNIVEGKSGDGRQTLDEFVSAHRRIMTELYSKKSITVKWGADQDLSLAGFPAKQLTFTYRDEKQGEIIEHHIMSLGRNEGRGVRVKVPLSAEARLMPAVMKLLKTYQPGRDQNAISPFLPKP